MGKIFYLMGKSSSGKDTIFKELKKRMPFLHTVTIYTTRPMRENERDGEEYFFVDDKVLDAFQKENRVIELREYHTVHGIWKYFTADDGKIRLEDQDYLMIGTLESFLSVKAYFGPDAVIPIYIELDDGERLQRALDRERAQEKPKYEEMCRRFLADTADFTEEKIRAAGISIRFYNGELNGCLAQIGEYIMQHMGK